MPYIFPKRQLKDGDVLDPLDLNDDVLPAVELYSGVINEHNLRGAGSGGLQTLTDSSIESNAFYSFIDEKLVINPVFGNTPPFNTPRLNNILQADKVTNDAGWSAIPFDSAATPGDRSVTGVVTTDNNASVWIEAMIQYSVSPDVFIRATYLGSDTAPTAVGLVNGTYRAGLGHNIGARIQFALRVDGAVLPWTITGHEDPYHASPRGEKPSVAYVISKTSKLLSNQPGPRIEQDADLGMMGNFCYPVRIGTVIDLTAGRHRIELVARRLTRVDQSTKFNAKDIISIYTRKLFAIQIPQIPRASAAFDSIEVVPFDSESDLSQTTLTGTIDATRDKFNAIKSGALARAALRDVHLPSPILSTARSVRSAGGVYGVLAEYPGFPGSGTAAAAAVGVSPGFDLVPNLQVSLGVSLTNAGETSKVLVLADVHIQDLYRRPAVAKVDEDVLGALAIAVSTNGGSSWEVREDSLVFFNKSLRGRQTQAKAASADLFDRVNMNIPLMTVIPVSSTSTLEIAVVATKIPTATALGAISTIVNEMTIRRGSISAIALRD